MEYRKPIAEAATLYFKTNYFLYAYGIGRALLAGSLLMTFLANSTTVLFAATVPNEVVPYCNGNPISLFCPLKEHLALAKTVACFILILVISGWRPQLTGVLHWWVNFSFMTSTPMVDGGEHAATIISFLLIPVTLLDTRTWHWQKVTEAMPGTKPKLLCKFVQLTFFEITRLQVALIYLHAAVGKTRVTEWIDGTALYYWLSDPVYGLSSGIEDLVMPLMQNPYMVALVSWGTIILELMLFVGFFLNRHQKFILLVCGIFFHVLIAICLGLISFSTIMIGALFILLYHPDTNKPR